MRRIPFIVLMIISIAPFCWGQQPDSTKSPVDFFKEHITLKIDDSTCNISGVYYFRNNRDYTGTFTVAFPFYTDSLTLYPDTMRAYFIDNLDTLAISVRRNIKNGLAVLNIPLKSGEITCWHLDYRQRIKSSRAVYIITSTASWGKPLEDATYEFIVPADYKSIVTWPEADTILRHDNNFEYISHKTNFMPRRDMEIKWDPAK